MERSVGLGLGSGVVPGKCIGQSDVRGRKFGDGTGACLCRRRPRRGFVSGAE